MVASRSTRGVGRSRAAVLMLAPVEWSWSIGVSLMCIHDLCTQRRYNDAASRPALHPSPPERPHRAEPGSPLLRARLDRAEQRLADRADAAEFQDVALQALEA